MRGMATRYISPVLRISPGRLFPWAVIAAAPLLVLALDPAAFSAFTGFAAFAFASTLPYIAFAVLMVAGLKASAAETHLARVFEGRETRMIFFASLVGGLAPFCSCEVIPFVAGLLAIGAPISAIMAFWLSSPLIDPPALFITAAALGWPFALGKAVIAVGLGLLGGFALKLLHSWGMIGNAARPAGPGGGCGCPPPTDGRPQWRFWQDEARLAVFRSELASNALFLAKWLAFAYMLEAALVTYVPASAVASVVGGTGAWPVVIAAIVGMPAYLNSYIAPPLVAGLMEQGMIAGAAMAFMTAGAVSSVPAMAAVWSLVRPHVFALYLGLGLSRAILAGLLIEAFLEFHP